MVPFDWLLLHIVLCFILKTSKMKLKYFKYI